MSSYKTWRKVLYSHLARKICSAKEHLLVNNTPDTTYMLPESIPVPCYPKYLT